MTMARNPNDNSIPARWFYENLPDGDSRFRGSNPNYIGTVDRKHNQYMPRNWRYRGSEDKIRITYTFPDCT